jgi:hypothetical protein
MPSFEHTYDRNVRRLHRTLMRFGWALNPHFALGMFFSQLTDYAKSITVEQKREGSKDVALQLHRLLFRCSFSPRLRAYQVVRASKPAAQGEVKPAFQHQWACRPRTGRSW